MLPSLSGRVGDMLMQLLGRGAGASPAGSTGATAGAGAVAPSGDNGAGAGVFAAVLGDVAARVTPQAMPSETTPEVTSEAGATLVPLALPVVARPALPAPTMEDAPPPELEEEHDGVDLFATADGWVQTRLPSLESLGFAELITSALPPLVIPQDSPPRLAADIAPAPIADTAPAPVAAAAPAPAPAPLASLAQTLPGIQPTPGFAPSGAPLSAAPLSAAPLPTEPAASLPAAPRPAASTPSPEPSESAPPLAAPSAHAPAPAPPVLDAAPPPTSATPPSPEGSPAPPAAFEGTDASVASQVVRQGVRNARVVVPTAQGAVRAEVRIDRATERVDVRLDDAGELGSPARARVSELRRGLAARGLALESLDTTGTPRPPTARSIDAAPIQLPDAPRLDVPDAPRMDVPDAPRLAADVDRLDMASLHGDRLESEADGAPADRRHAPHGDEPRGASRAEHADSDAAPEALVDQSPGRLTHPYDNSPPVGHLLDARF